jgi:nitrate reductase assembly molybdenum cofactor insertion protein NarJ
MTEMDGLVAAYRLIAELFASPGARDGARIAELVRGLRGAPEPALNAIQAFLSDPRSVDEQEHIRSIELAPPCPLYASAYLAGEDAGEQRRCFLSDLINVYWQFGLVPSTPEPPDYLPLMVDFAAISAGRMADRGGPRARRGFLPQSLRPCLGPLRAGMEKNAIPHAALVRALEAVVDADLALSAHLASEDPAPADERRVRRLPVVTERP